MWYADESNARVKSDNLLKRSVTAGLLEAAHQTGRGWSDGRKDNLDEQRLASNSSIVLCVSSDM